MLRKKKLAHLIDSSREAVGKAMRAVLNRGEPGTQRPSAWPEAAAPTDRISGTSSAEEETLPGFGQTGDGPISGAVTLSRTSVVAPVHGEDPRTVIPAARPGLTQVRFDVAAPTEWGQVVCVAGSRPELGGWDPGQALPLEVAEYPRWSVQIALEAGQSVEYKYVRRNPDGSVTWEGRTGNRVLDISASSTEVIAREDDSLVWAG